MVTYMNFALTNKKFGKIVFILTAISFSWLAMFGLLHHMSEMRMDSAMGGSCLFNGQIEVCAMNFSEHIALWQGMLVSSPQDVGLFGLLILAAVLAAVIVFREKSFVEFSERAALRRRLYAKQHPQTGLFNLLTEVFARGILNPKIYAPATI
ncbi:MAG: hypothetical protein Q7R85_03580 [bacterium]|nr:hypothetical protein [bacterium]